jgi:pimeloyl-ACP methyl ester carboxylesterase
MGSSCSTEHLTNHDDSKMYRDSDNIGYVESSMNGAIFLPPDRDRLPRNNPPHWVKFIEMPNSNKVSYFLIEPDKDNRVLNNKKNDRYILWSHGNASDLAAMYSSMQYLHRSMDGKIGIIAYDYEGYGYSDGICAEKNCYNNLALMIRHAINEIGINRENLFLIGQSLGTGVVIDFCSTHSWKTPIILLSPYKSILRVMVDPHWTDPMTNLIIDSIDMFTSHYKMHKIQCPVIIYHGLRDRLIHPKHSVEMYNNHKDKITLVLLRDADHNDMLNHIKPSQLFEMIDRFAKPN